ncbi:undecaprenyl-phosphate alpha-N-acetylglucosaminyl 1-phosphate transferase [Microbacterium faecale]|uniref:Undecaprenyl-phosphate alpha-N-acetylglucosaminyl 1-phosphate transferase n=1 Tax=Microbacterium faecale TaxID=1804630 RepID=A0A916Y8B2_9MICO|nr:MraY family glycosyltransferase [Microbacterium faecale]GGD34422.1 undecaprenyl-phosphate alpha-N-acetylglucosaminyl 1-phosphate transferase [Microbacterium faecale]
MKLYLLTALITAALTFALSWAVWRIALRYKLYPAVRERDVHRRPTPRLGGVAMFLGIVAAFLISRAFEFFDIIWIEPRVVWSVLGATVVIALIGLADDLWDLDWFIKLGAQFLAAGIVAIGGGVQIYALPIGGIAVWSSSVSIILTMFAIVIVMNAVNFIDGLDGLVAGVCLIANGVFFIYSYILVRDAGATTYANLGTFIAAVVIGACAGFLPINWNPAKMFMGDTGALVIGLLMATSGIAITGQIQPAALDPDVTGRSQILGTLIPVILPLIVVLLPLLDFGLAVIRRMSRGKSPFSPDREHLHHRMLDMGHSDRAATLIFYAWTAIASLTVLLMYIFTGEDWFGGHWFGEYWLAVAYGVIGIAACLVLALVPSRTARRSDAAGEEDAHVG